MFAKERKNSKVLIRSGISFTVRRTHHYRWMPYDNDNPVNPWKNRVLTIMQENLQT